MTATHRGPRGTAQTVLAATLAGLGVLAFLALCTFGVTATAAPRDVPMVIAPEQPAPDLEAVVAQVAAQPSEEIEWLRADSGARARQLLDDKEAYGALILATGPGGGAEATVLVNGGMNAPGAQFAATVLPTVGQQAVARAGDGAPPVRTEFVNPSSPAGRTVPVAASSLLWIIGLVASALTFLLLGRAATTLRPWLLATAVLAPVAGVVGAGAVVGFAELWDSGIDMSWPTFGFLALVGTAFVLVQGAVLGWLGLRGMALLAPLYLLAPAVAGQPPEFLLPAYRALLWSWTPFRFSAEGLRSLLFFDGAPGIGGPVTVMVGLAVGAVLLLAARAARPPSGGPEHPADGRSLHGAEPAPVR